MTGSLSAWGNFFVIVGSSGGALIGLQFVVITLVAERRRSLLTPASLSAFGTPTVVHFVGALLLSAITSAPWRSLAHLATALGVCGVGGLGYGAIVFRRAHRQTTYQPVWQDWLWYSILPCTAYAAVAAAAALLHRNIELALFVVAAGALGLLLIGIHNAWDSVTHIIITSAEADDVKTGDRG